MGKAEAKAPTECDASIDAANEAQQPTAKTKKSPEEKQALQLAKQQEKAAEKAAKAEAKAMSSEEKEAKKLIEMIEHQHCKAEKSEAKVAIPLDHSAAGESLIQAECVSLEEATDDAAAVLTSQEPPVSEGALALQEMGFGEAEELEGWVVACDGDVQKVVTMLTQ